MPRITGTGARSRVASSSASSCVLSPSSPSETAATATRNACMPRLLRLCEAVAYTGLGEQPARSRRVGLQLGAQLFHVDAQILGLLRAARSPDLLQQRAVRDHQADVLREYLEQPELDRGQVQHLARGI